MIYSHPPLVLSLAGNRAVGKDTLFSALHSVDNRFRSYAFAAPLKRDLVPFLLQHFDIDPQTATGSAKELIRPMLIAYGCAKRAIDPDYWVSRTIMQIQSDWNGRDASFIPVVTDCRFENEARLLRKSFGDGFRLINLTRKGAPPPTEEEEKHYRRVAELADHCINWGDDTPEQRLDIAREIIKGLPL